MNVVYFDNIIKSDRKIENIISYLTDKGIFWLQEKYNISKNEIKNMTRDDKRLVNLYIKYPIAGFKFYTRIKKVKKKFYIISLYYLPYGCTEKVFEFDTLCDAFNFIENEKSNAIDIYEYPSNNKNIILLKLKDAFKKILRWIYGTKM